MYAAIGIIGISRRKKIFELSAWFRAYKHESAKKPYIEERRASVKTERDGNMEFKDLSPELQEKAKNAASPEELITLAKAEGYELSDEELESVAGGADWLCDGYSPVCSPKYSDPH